MGKAEEVPSSKSPISSRTLYYHTDHLGTPRELTNHAGDIVWAATYRAWGATQHIEYPAILRVVQDGNTLREEWVQQYRHERPVQNLRFQGQYFDEETGLHYNRFRYYDPEVGRFVSQDPIGLFGGDNLYQYAPNPVEWVDPLGLSSNDIPKGFKSWGQFNQFGQALQAGLAKIDKKFRGAVSYMHGSAATGVSYETKEKFDAGRTSDFDVAISQCNLHCKAKDHGLLRGDGTQTGPIGIGSNAARILGINDLLKKLSRMTGDRNVSVIIFNNPEAARTRGRVRGRSINIPGKYR